MAKNLQLTQTFFINGQNQYLSKQCSTPISTINDHQSTISLKLCDQLLEQPDMLILMLARYLVRIGRATPMLDMVCQRGNIPVAQIMLVNGAQSTYNALEDACINNHVGIVDLLLVSARALEKACENGKTLIVELLL